MWSCSTSGRNIMSMILEGYTTNEKAEHETKWWWMMREVKRRSLLIKKRVYHQKHTVLTGRRSKPIQVMNFKRLNEKRQEELFFGEIKLETEFNFKSFNKILQFNSWEEDGSCDGFSKKITRVMWERFNDLYLKTWTDWTWLILTP